MGVVKPGSSWTPLIRILDSPLPLQVRTKSLRSGNLRDFNYNMYTQSAQGIHTIPAIQKHAHINSSPKGRSTLGLKVHWTWTASRLLLPALNQGCTNVDRKWIESGLGQSTYDRWVEVDQSWLGVISDGWGFCHWHIYYLYLWLDSKWLLADQETPVRRRCSWLWGADNIQFRLQGIIQNPVIYLKVASSLS